MLDQAQAGARSGAETAPPPEWRISDAAVPYEAAVAEMEARVAAIRAGTAPELVWLLEHPPLYTAGTSADPAAELLQPDRFPVFRTGRGGRMTYHGPGQRVGYVLLDLQRRGGDVHEFVKGLEGWLIATLAQFNLKGELRPGRVGVWIDMAAHGGRPGDERKIGALGVRVRRGVSYHGVSLNVDPDLTHFAGIVPCGISEHGVTSLHALGQLATLAEVDLALRHAWDKAFPGWPDFSNRSGAASLKTGRVGRKRAEGEVVPSARTGDAPNDLFSTILGPGWSGLPGFVADFGR